MHITLYHQIVIKISLQFLIMKKLLIGYIVHKEHNKVVYIVPF